MRPLLLVLSCSPLLLPLRLVHVAVEYDWNPMKAPLLNSPAGVLWQPCCCQGVYEACKCSGLIEGAGKQKLGAVLTLMAKLLLYLVQLQLRSVETRGGLTQTHTSFVRSIFWI